MKFRKRQIILASLIAALGTAVYLNWQFAGNKGLEVTNVLDSSDELGEARYVNNVNFSEKNQTSNTSEKTKKYFAEAQLNRQKTKEESEERLKSLISTPTINKDTKDEIEKNLEIISKISSQELNIENLIKSKGFSECLVCIENDECSVVVNPGTLNENSVLIIKDIVAGQSSISPSKIKIMEAK